MSAVALFREDLDVRIGAKAADVRRLVVGFPCGAGLDPGAVALDRGTRIAVRAGGQRCACRPASRRRAAGG